MEWGRFYTSTFPKTGSRAPLSFIVIPMMFLIVRPTLGGPYQQEVSNSLTPLRPAAFLCYGFRGRTWGPFSEEISQFLPLSISDLFGLSYKMQAMWPHRVWRGHSPLPRSRGIGYCGSLDKSMNEGISLLVIIIGVLVWGSQRSVRDASQRPT